MSDEWDSCPLCGGQDLGHGPGEYVYCAREDCGCMAPFEAWQRRTPGPATKLVLERAEQALKFSICNVPLQLYELRAFIAEWKGDAE